MPSGGVGSKTMSGIKQSQARGLTINDPARRAQTTFIALPLVFALFLSSGFAQESPKPPEEHHSFSFGAETDFTSGYVWRGLLLDDGPITQPPAWISKSGFTFAAWTSLPLTKTSYIGLSKRTLNFIGAEGSLRYCRPYLYFRPHSKFSNIAGRRLREYLDSPTIDSFGLAMGVEF